MRCGVNVKSKVNVKAPSTNDIINNLKFVIKCQNAEIDKLNKKNSELVTLLISSIIIAVMLSVALV